MDFKMAQIPDSYASQIANAFPTALEFILAILKPLYTMFPNLHCITFQLTSDLVEDKHELIIEQKFKLNFKKAQTCKVSIFNMEENVLELDQMETESSDSNETIIISDDEVQTNFDIDKRHFSGIANQNTVNIP